MIHAMMKEITWTYNGMDYPNFNCWGFVRYARNKLLNLPILDSLPNVSAFDKKSATKACLAMLGNTLKEVKTAEVGAIVSLWKNKLLIHVGLIVLVDNKLSVLELKENAGVSCVSLKDWLKGKIKVIYYNDY